MNKSQAATYIAKLCKEAGCSEKEKDNHFKQFVKFRWNPHPPEGFLKWWNPSLRDPQSGADIGGHPEAFRVWSRKDPGRYVHRRYGINTENAWNRQEFRDEYNAWVLAGSPLPPSPFISVAATLEAQKKFWKELRPLIAKIGKKMPETYLDVVNPLRGDQDEGDPF